MRQRWIYVAVALLLIAAAVILFMRRGPSGPDVIDLVARFPDAEKRTTMPSLHEGFNVLDVDILGQTKRCIFAHPHSRIIWKVDIPERAKLTTAVALQMHVWDHNGDGALFRIGVSDGTNYTELFRKYLNPYRREEDRKWSPVELDLSKWGGQHVQVIFNTEPGEIGNAVNDACVWGNPRIVASAAESQ